MKSNSGLSLSIKYSLNVLKFIFTRAACAYLIIFLLMHVIIDFDKIKFGLDLRRLNLMMPNSYDYLLKVEAANQLADREKLQSFYEFYLNVTQVFPQRADAFGMLGFCYYYGGDLNSALQSFEEARRLKPDHFWFSYNIGVIYFNLKKYDKAREYFKKALSNDINLTYSFILNSHEIYMPILKTFDRPKEEAENRLIQAFQFCQELVKLLDLKLNNKPVSLPAQLVVRIL